MKYSIYEEIEVREDEEELCHNCINCYDNEESLHIYRCKKHGICVDCSDNYCEGKDFKKRGI